MFLSKNRLFHYHAYNVISRFCFCSQRQSIRGPSGPSGPSGSRSSQLTLELYMKSAASRKSVESVSFSNKCNLFFQSLYKCYYSSSLQFKLFYGSLISLIMFGDYLDRKYIEYRDPNGMYSFLAESPEDSIMDVCRTGDIMVFQRPILSFNPANIIRTSLRQFACKGPYDHCGIIIHNSYDGNFPYVVEINQNYSKKLRITPFDERILTARESAIFVRQIHKSNKQIITNKNKKFSDWIDCKVNGFDDKIHNKNNIDEIDLLFNNNSILKRDSIISILMTLCFNGDNTVKIRSSIRDLTRKIRQNEYEITTQLNGKKINTGQALNIQLNNIQTKRHGRIRNTDQLIKETRILKLQRILKKDNLKKREKYIRKMMRINSSQFIGYIWRYLEILDLDGAKPWEIRPQHFADSKIEVPMIGTTRLGHVQFLKTHNETDKINDSERRFRTSKFNKWEQKSEEPN